VEKSENLISDVVSAFDVDDGVVIGFTNLRSKSTLAFEREFDASFACFVANSKVY